MDSPSVYAIKLNDVNDRREQNSFFIKPATCLRGKWYGGCLRLVHWGHRHFVLDLGLWPLSVGFSKELIVCVCVCVCMCVCVSECVRVCVRVCVCVCVCVSVCV